jgi:rubrerythrin
METKSNEILKVLETSRDIEAYCAAIYNYYADLFADDEEVRGLWSTLNIEEENHARQFVMAIKMGLERVIVAVDLDRAKASQSLHRIKTIYDTIHTAPPSLVGALQSAIALEQGLSGYHLNAFAAFEDESMLRLFDAMMRADELHLEKIEAMYKKRAGLEVDPIW